MYSIHSLISRSILYPLIFLKNIASISSWSILLHCMIWKFKRNDYIFIYILYWLWIIKLVPCSKGWIDTLSLYLSLSHSLSLTLSQTVTAVLYIASSELRTIDQCLHHFILYTYIVIFYIVCNADTTACMIMIVQ